MECKFNLLILLPDFPVCAKVEEWGYVEGGHDIDEADMRVKIAACSVFMRLL